MQSTPQSIHADLIDWGVLEPEPPVRFTRRFQGALARAAAQLQQTVESSGPMAGSPIQHQAEAALAAHLQGMGKEVGLGHRQFVVAVHLAGLPEAVRKILGA